MYIIQYNKDLFIHSFIHTQGSKEVDYFLCDIQHFDPYPQ